jgi:hypothetical protein
MSIGGADYSDDDPNPEAELQGNEDQCDQGIDAKVMPQRMEERIAKNGDARKHTSKQHAVEPV